MTSPLFDNYLLDWMEASRFTSNVQEGPSFLDAIFSAFKALAEYFSKSNSPASTIMKQGVLPPPPAPPAEPVEPTTVPPFIDEEIKDFKLAIARLELQHQRCYGNFSKITPLSRAALKTDFQKVGSSREELLRLHPFVTTHPLFLEWDQRLKVLSDDFNKSEPQVTPPVTPPVNSAEPIEPFFLSPEITAKFKDKIAKLQGYYENHDKFSGLEIDLRIRLGHSIEKLEGYRNELLSLHSNLAKDPTFAPLNAEAIKLHEAFYATAPAPEVVTYTYLRQKEAAKLKLIIKNPNLSPRIQNHLKRYGKMLTNAKEIRIICSHQDDLRALVKPIFLKFARSKLFRSNL